MSIYLDNAATTRPSDAVRAAMGAALGEGEGWGNPSSLHRVGIGAARLVEGRAERARVDAEEQLALLHQRALAVVPGEQVALHLRPDLGVDVALGRPDELAHDAHVALRDGRHHDGYGRRGRRRGAAASGQCDGEGRFREGSACRAHDISWWSDSSA